MARPQSWTTRLSHPSRGVDSADLACARAVEHLLHALREGRVPPEIDGETDARLHELLGYGPRR